MTALTALRPADPLDGFEVPAELEADGPPEAGGRRRDGVRLLVASAEGLTHLRFADLTAVLTPGDLLVVNVSRTVPAAVTTLDGLVLHLSTSLPGGLWIVEPRRPAGPASLPLDGTPPERLDLPAGGRARLLAPYGSGRRLWWADLRLERPVGEYLDRWGRPLRYRHVSRPWPLDAYQTIFARVPGSAEMPSAGRPFSHELVTELVSTGVSICPITLHAGVSSLEPGEGPIPEWFEVPTTTARAVNGARRAGNRVVAVGTTVVRALETTVDGGGTVHPGRGWTELVVTREHRIGAVDGLITGWHEPASSHLSMLEAVAGRDLLAASYEEALAAGYRWHEFGDSHLILSGVPSSGVR